MTTKNLLDKKAAAASLGVSTRQVQNYMAAGDLRPVKSWHDGGRVFFTPAEVERCRRRRKGAK